MMVVHQPGDCQPENRFRRVDGVSAGERNTRFFTDSAASIDHFAPHFGREFVDRPAKDGDRHQRCTAHSINIADRIGCSDFPKDKGVIHDRHKKVCGREYGGAVAQVKSCRIISIAVSDQ